MSFNQQDKKVSDDEETLSVTSNNSHTFIN